MNKVRRKLVVGGLAVAGAGLLSRGAQAAGPALDPIPALPRTPTPGRPGDFDFLTGEWRIHHDQLNGAEWTEFDGEATVRGILGGVCSVEELRIPARGFSGMGLRLLDVEKKAWADHWVNGKSGVVATPGMPGSFEDGAGIFVADEEEDGEPVKVVGVWDRITPRSCRWRQAVSRDGGVSWAQNWIMHWTRA